MVAITTEIGSISVGKSLEVADLGLSTGGRSADAIHSKQLDRLYCVFLDQSTAKYSLKGGTFFEENVNVSMRIRVQCSLHIEYFTSIIKFGRSDRKTRDSYMSSQAS